MVEKIYLLWLDIFENAGTRSIKEQSNALALFNGWYKKANYQEQGEIHHMVHKYMSENCNCSECEKEKKDG